jgi:hypothetical protein
MFSDFNSLYNNTKVWRTESIDADGVTIYEPITQDPSLWQLKLEVFIEKCTLDDFQATILIPNIETTI